MAKTKSQKVIAEYHAKGMSSLHKKMGHNPGVKIPKAGVAKLQHSRPSPNKGTSKFHKSSYGRKMTKKA